MSYAIAFDLDRATLEELYPSAGNWRNAYNDIKKTLKEMGFLWQQGSVYFGDEEVTAVKCVLSVQKLAQKYDWFKPSVSDIRMLRIEEMNDLSEAL